MSSADFTISSGTHLHSKQAWSWCQLLEFLPWTSLFKWNPAIFFYLVIPTVEPQCVYLLTFKFWWLFFKWKLQKTLQKQRRGKIPKDRPQKQQKERAPRWAIYPITETAMDLSDSQTLTQFWPFLYNIFFIVVWETTSKQTWRLCMNSNQWIQSLLDSLLSAAVKGKANSPDIESQNPNSPSPKCLHYEQHRKQQLLFIQVQIWLKLSCFPNLLLQLHYRWGMEIKENSAEAKKAALSLRRLTQRAATF